MRVANIDMTNSSHTCPQGLRTLTSPKRLCGINISEAGCSSATFAAHGMEYSHMCGKVIGYQWGVTQAFYGYTGNRGLTIDDHYVTGASLTHGRNPRKHIWTLAAGLSETQHSTEGCPCSHAYSAYAIPPWVGDDYFCDTAHKYWQGSARLYPNDPLWDGEGCESPSTCCSFNNPPWFSKQLPSPTTDDIEMRLCAGRIRTDQDVPVEKIELYTQ